MMRGLQILIVAVFGWLAASAAAGETAAAEKFLQMTRERAAMQNSFADLRGNVTHLRRNQGGANTYPIRFVIRFTGSRVQARLTLFNRESHTFERNLRTRQSKTSCDAAGKPLLEELGFRIGDLTMDFLDYPVHSELEGETLKTLSCRVLMLMSPEKKPVKVWISGEYMFALKAEFYDSLKNINNKPERTLEITGFKKVKDYYVATDIALFSADFRSRIAFDDCRADSADSRMAKQEFK